MRVVDAEGNAERVADADRVDVRDDVPDHVGRAAAAHRALSGILR